MKSESRSAAPFRAVRVLSLLGCLMALFAVAAPACSNSSAGNSTAALQSCSLNSDCSSGLICALGKCRAACVTSTDCGIGGSCITGQNASGMSVAVCQVAADKNKPCEAPSDCPVPLACASDYRCRNLCTTNADCNVYGAMGRVCAKDANGVDYCADPNEIMNGVITAAPPDGAATGTMVTEPPDATVSSSSGTSGGSSSGKSDGSSSGASSGADSSGGASSGTSSGASSGTSSGASSGTSSGASSGASSGSSSGFVDAGCVPGCGVGYQCVGTTCQACGTQNTACCSGSTPCGANLACVSGTCQCGGANQLCCANNQCTGGLTCSSGMCTCGAAGQACCPGTGGGAPTCNGTLKCAANTTCSCQVACSGETVMRSDGTLWYAYNNPPVQILDSSASALVATQFSTYYSTYSSGSTAYGLGCAVKSDGTVWCWGSNSYGQLGNGGNGTSSANAVQVFATQTGTGTGGLLTGITKVFVDAVYGDLACAINSSGSVWCWGYGNYGSLGNGYTANVSYAKKVVTTVGGATQFTGVDQMAVAEDHVCAHKTDGTVWCWGSNNYGQIGVGGSTSNTYTVPTQVTALGSAATSVMVSTNLSCAVDNASDVWCWGYNGYGALGTGSTTPSYSAVPVKVETTDAGPAFGSVAQVQSNSNYYSSCALVSSDGSIWCWGNYSSSQGYIPQPYTENQNAITSVAVMCDNGSSNPSFIDYKGQFHFAGSAQSTYQVTCP